MAWSYVAGRRAAKNRPSSRVRVYERDDVDEGVLEGRYRVREQQRIVRRTARQVDGLREKLDTPTSQGDDDE